MPTSDARAVADLPRGPVMRCTIFDLNPSLYSNMLLPSSASCYPAPDTCPERIKRGDNYPDAGGRRDSAEGVVGERLRKRLGFKERGRLSEERGRRTAAGGGCPVGFVGEGRCQAAAGGEGVAQEVVTGALDEAGAVEHEARASAEVGGFGGGVARASSRSQSQFGGGVRLVVPGALFFVVGGGRDAEGSLTSVTKTSLGV